MRSNCHLEAWRRYRRGEAVALIFRPTRFARLESAAAHPLWWPLKLVGIALQWTCWPLTHLGEWLRSGRWYHVQWIDKHGDQWEFVMTDGDGTVDARTRALAPPLIFRGVVRRVGDE